VSFAMTHATPVVANVAGTSTVVLGAGGGSPLTRWASSRMGVRGAAVRLPSFVMAPVDCGSSSCGSHGRMMLRTLRRRRYQGALPSHPRIRTARGGGRSRVTECVSSSGGWSSFADVVRARLPHWGTRGVDEAQRGNALQMLLGPLRKAPLGMYAAEPLTALHGMDPRVKQAWLCALLILQPQARSLAALFLLIATVLNFQPRVWKPQLTGLLALALIVFVMTACGSDGLPPVYQQRAPTAGELASLGATAGDSLGFVAVELPRESTGFRYTLIKAGWLTVTQKGVRLASQAAVLLFTLIQGSNVILMTTTPEALAASMRWFLSPFRLLGTRGKKFVDETVLTLLLSLRFLSLVFEEVQNLLLAVVARNVRWSELGGGGIEVAIQLLTRLFHNLFDHADSIAVAMGARGFTSATEHEVYLLSPMQLTAIDVVAVALLGTLICAPWLSPLASDLYKLCLVHVPLLLMQHQ